MTASTPNLFPEETRRAIVRVRTTDGDREDWGTGFVVAPGLLLTALHVVARKADPPEFFTGPNRIVYADGATADYEIVDGAWDHGADWALLRTEPRPDIAPLRLSTVGAYDREWRTYAFPRTQARDGMTLTGVIENREARLFDDPAIQIYSKELADNATASGASGGPLLVGDRVVGIFRFALSDAEGVVRAGTLYASPLDGLVGREDVVVHEPPVTEFGEVDRATLDRVESATGMAFFEGGSSTAYLVAPSWMATWHDGLAELGVGAQVEVKLGGGTHPARVVLEPADGCILLRLAEPVEGVEALDTARLDRDDVTWMAHGFPALDQGSPNRIHGSVASATHRDRPDGPEVMKLHSSQLSTDRPDLLGMEGAPVLAGGRVVGHLAHARSFGIAVAAKAGWVRELLARAPDAPTAGDDLDVVGSAGGSIGLALPELEPGRYHVALCYVAADTRAERWVEALASRLEGTGFAVLFDGYGPGDGPDSVSRREEVLKAAETAVVVVSPSWPGSKVAEPLEAYLVGRRDRDPGFRLVPALVGGTQCPEWYRGEEIRFEAEPFGRPLERLEYALVGLEPPLPGTATAAAHRARTRPADELIRMVGDAEDREASEGTSKEVAAAEAGGVLRVLELWDAWLSSGSGDRAAPLAVAESLVRLGRPELALEVLGHAGSGTRSRQLRALALGDLPEKLDDAIHILEQLRAEGQRDIETTSILAGRLKQRWRDTGNDNDLRAAQAHYAEAFARTRDPYPGINAAAVALSLGERDEARRIAEELRALLESTAFDAPDPWGAASLAEARLILGDDDGAREAYAAFAARRPNAWRELGTMRRQARMNLRALGRPDEEIEDLLARTFFIPRVAAFTGHLTDAPDRPEPRFPEEAVPGVRKRLRERLKALGVGVAFVSAARGADLSFIAEMVRRTGSEVNVLLPFPREAFVEASVGPEWKDRFDELVDREGVEVEELLEEDPGDEAGRDEAYAACNREILGRAAAKATLMDQDPVLLHVWDGKRAGHTWGLIRAWRDELYPDEAIGLG